MTKAGLVMILLSLLTFCADKKKSNHIVFKENDMAKIRLQSVKIDFNEFMNPLMIDRKGKFLFVMESNRTSADVPAIHIIDIENWSYYRSKGVKGAGPYELAGANAFFAGIVPDSFWVYSAQDKKMLEYAIQDTSRLAINEYKQSEIVFKVVKISQATDSTFLGISVDDPNRLIEFHRNGKKLAGYGEWEKVESHPDLNNFQLYQLNAGWFKGDQELGLHVKTCIFRDRIEIFDYTSKEFIIVDGPSLDLPTFQEVGLDVDIPQDDNPYTYRDISFTQDYIFVLYGGIGESEYRRTSKVAEKIYVFTHKGEPVTMLELDCSLMGLTVDPSRKKIYGITTDENPGIAVFDLPDELL